MAAAPASRFRFSLKKNFKEVFLAFFKKNFRFCPTPLQMNFLPHCPRKKKEGNSFTSPSHPPHPPQIFFVFYSTPSTPKIFFTHHPQSPLMKKKLLPHLPHKYKHTKGLFYPHIPHRNSGTYTHTTKKKTERNQRLSCFHSGVPRCSFTYEALRIQRIQRDYAHKLFCDIKGVICLPVGNSVDSRKFCIAHTQTDFVFGEGLGVCGRGEGRGATSSWTTKTSPTAPPPLGICKVYQGSRSGGWGGVR